MPRNLRQKRFAPRPCFRKRKTATPPSEVAERNGRAERKKAAVYRDFFLWRFLRSLFFRLCVAILWRLRFLPQGILVDGLVQGRFVNIRNLRVEYNVLPQLMPSELLRLLLI